MSHNINPPAKRINSTNSNGESGLLRRILSPVRQYLSSSNGNGHYEPLDVGIVGFGVVGSSTANGFKSLGHNVYINDIKDLSEYRNRFHILQPYDLSQTQATFLILPTPTRPLIPGGKIDLSAYNPVINSLGEQLRNHDRYHVFVVRSTVPPGTTREWGSQLERISGKRAGEEFGLAMNPEFLRAYNAEKDFFNPKLVVIGEGDKRAGDLVEKVYSPLHAPIMRMGLDEAEIVKYANNIYNATKISFFNELLLQCESLGLDFETVRQAAMTTPEAIWNPEYGTRGGLPYGGTCLPKDTIALLSYLKERWISSPLLEATIAVNETMKNRNGKSEEFAKDEYFRNRQHITYDNLRTS